MVRTKGDIGKVTGGKATSKQRAMAPPSKSSPKGGKREYGNPVCPRETPSWQKPITTFFKETEQPNATGVSEVNESKNENLQAPEIHEVNHELTIETDGQQLCSK